MANSLLTINMITRECVSLWKNSNAFIQNIDRQYDDQFARGGAKIGTTLRVRLPSDFTVSTGAAVQAQDTAEQSTTLVVATQKNVAVSYNSIDRTMSLDDVSERVLAPMVNNLAGAVASDIMSTSEGGICNYVANTDGTAPVGMSNGTGAVTSPTNGTVLDSGAILSNNSAMLQNRRLFADPRTMARMVSTMQGLFNPQADVAKQFRTGQVYDALNYRWFEDQTILKHTTGSFSAGGTVNGAGQTGTNLVVNAITGTLNKGDIITIDSVNAVNRITKQSTGELRQFVVTSNVLNGATSIPIYPAIVAPVNGNQVQYQTVDSNPANAAQVHLVSNASETYRKNIGIAKDAVTMATADLMLPGGGVIEEARQAFDSVSMRMISQYEIGTDQAITRLDVLYGALWLRPEWAVIVADSIT